jgi:hypothetical protein
MKATCVSVLAMLLVLSACTPRLAGLRNVETIRLSHEKWSKLVLIRGQLNNRIGLVSREGELRIGSFTPGSLEEHLDQVLLSPDEVYLAVVSVGEGHPILDICEMESIISAIENGNHEVESFNINPYPGGISIVKWADDQHLLLYSDMDLNLPDSLRLGFDISDAPQRLWLLDVRSGAVKRVDVP